MSEIKKLTEDEYSEARKIAQEEINNKLKIEDIKDNIDKKLTQKEQVKKLLKLNKSIEEICCILNLKRKRILDLRWKINKERGKNE